MDGGPVRLSRFDLNLLVAFDALMGERSVTRAAERLGIGQPAMSAALARLRRTLGDPLLVREGRVMVPTAFAESLVDPVHEALGSLDAVLHLASAFDPSRDHRTFSIVASDSVALVLLRPVLARLAAEAPNIRVHLKPVVSESEDNLRSDYADLVIMPREVLKSISHLPNEALYTDRYVCAVATDHPDVRDEISIEQFSSLPYLASSAGPLRSAVEEQLDLLGIPRRIEVSTRTFVLAPYLLPGTRMITMIHERLAQVMQSQYHMPIRAIEPPMRLQPIHQTMVWAERHTHDAGHRWLRTRIVELTGELLIA
jgi:DNA-binding transcriptional LysR family regulator